MVSIQRKSAAMAYGCHDDRISNNQLTLVLTEGVRLILTCLGNAHLIVVVGESELLLNLSINEV